LSTTSLAIALLSSLSFAGHTLTGAALTGAGQISAKERLEQIRNEIRGAHARGDPGAYVAKSRAMQEFLNGSPTAILQLMVAEIFAGDQDAALQSLKQFIAMGQSNQQAFQGKQFDELRKVPKFQALQAEMLKNDMIIQNGTEVFRFPQEDLVPEDVDYDPATQHFYATCVLKGEILSLDSAGHSRVFAHAPDSWPMMALKIDPGHRTLWATEVALHGFASVPKSTWNRSVILIYDLDSGRLKHRVAGPSGTTLGDMALTQDGDAILSDNDGGIYRVLRKNLSLERIDRGDFISPQTAVVSRDGRHVFVPDYLRGIGVLNIPTKQVTWLAGGTHALNGVDGLYLKGQSLIATQNGTSPERVVSFELDPSLTRVQSERIIERATHTLGDPTHGVIVDRWFYYIANSGWDGLEDDGTRKAGSVPSKALLMRVDLTTMPN
jgi:hypothetical protein